MQMVAHEPISVFYKKLPTFNPQKTEGHEPANKNIKSIKTQNKSKI